MLDVSRASDWSVGAGTAFVTAAALLLALHGGAVGKATAVAASGPAADAAPGGVEVRRTVHLMGTRLEGTAWAADREGGLGALETAFDAVEREEELLSSWREGTALARLNAAAPGEAVEVPARLADLLEEARRVARATGGAFDPAVGALVDAWDLRGEGRRPSGRELASARRASGLGCFEPGPGRRITPRCPDAWIDAGAFGKGSALRRARAALVGDGGGAAAARREALDDPAAPSDADAAALLDFGGQLLAVGAPPGREAWPAAVAHPARRDRPVAELRLRDRSAATTSASERFVSIDGRARGHVLDPRTGRPAPAWGSVTVVAEDPLRADALSTALFVMGPAEGWRWARERDDVGVLLLALEGRTEAASPAGEHVTPTGATAPGVTACWNAAMARWLAGVEAPRRCPDAAAAGGSRMQERGTKQERSTKHEHGSTRQDRRSDETRTEARGETSGG